MLAHHTATNPETPQTKDARGVFVTLRGAETAKFVPWTGEDSVQAQLDLLRDAGGGELAFAPGDYELKAGLRIVKVNNLRIAGTPATRLHFAPEPTVRPTLLEEATWRDRTLRVTNPESMKVGRSYQLYREDLKGDRILEFTVAAIEGDTIHLAIEVSLMRHVKEIPPGTVVIDEINGFRIIHCDNLVIEGLEIDGMNRGDVHGHTTFCGILAGGIDRQQKRPTSTGLTIRGCRIHSMMGRGICVYRMENILIEGNQVHTIDTQAVEIDHFATGVVRCNYISDAAVGVTLNDAFDSLVEANSIQNCRAGVSMVQHFAVDPFNKGNVVRNNVLVGGATGVHIQAGIKDNQVIDNLFGSLDEARWVKQKGGNTEERNAALE